MKKLFSVALIAIMMLSVSCELASTDKSNEPDGVTVLTDNLINVPRVGGDYEIFYTIQGGSTNVNVTTDNSEMFKVINFSSPSIVRISVADNSTMPAREGKITITCGSASAEVTFKQEGIEVVSVTANQFIGSYYGESFGENLGHYWIILSKDGFVNSSTVNGGEYFRFDLVAPAPADLNNITLPDGDYSFISSDSLEAYVPFSIVSLGSTDYSYIDEYGEAWKSDLVTASLKVSGNRFELVAVTETKKFNVTFEGDYKISQFVITEYISSLTEDTVIDVANCDASVTCFGDYWDCGYQNWQIEFLSANGLYYGPYLSIDFLNESTTEFTGTYEASGFTVEDPTEPNFRPGVFVSGFRLSDDANNFMGSFYTVNNDGRCLAQTTLYEGTVTITANADGTHTIVIDALDDAPQKNKITLNWTGNLYRW